MNRIYLFTLAFVLLIAVGCVEGPKSSYGFTLPDGDAAMGKEMFETFACQECHTVSGVEFPDLEFVTDKQVALGGEVARIQTYGELVTSIINPSHKIATGYKVTDVSEEGASKRTNYNSVLTVSDLIDIVAFLQSKYRLKPFDATPYNVYHYGP